MAETYHEPEHRVGYTDEEFEKYGDAVLMTWRDWVGLREKLKEMYEAAPLGKEPLSWWGARRVAIDEVMREMDETQP